ncbi:hypothetical protein G9A89_016698 [Geosiphon pyriformis]|nr:hypothetical protein G9A89_016698 [Geosiphon pyriformis]
MLSLLARFNFRINCQKVFPFSSHGYLKDKQLCFNTFKKRTKHTNNTNKTIKIPYEPPTDKWHQSNLFTFDSGKVQKGTLAGRSIAVRSGAVMNAYKKLWSVLNANKIRREVMRNRYYEKPTVKRKRLKKESNRRRFKEAVAKKVAIIMKMKQRGL